MDGTVWTRREQTHGGAALYGLAGAAPGAPAEVLQTLADLEAMGITGSADALPLPVGPSVVASADRLSALLAPTQVLPATSAVRIRWPDGRPPIPFGCRWCGIEHSGHGRRYHTARGGHSWEQPTQAQILARMKARRAARTAVCRCPDPNDPADLLPRPLAPVIDPWRCEADACRMHDYLVGRWLTPVAGGAL
ncbi:hypothetical protein [Streptomyces sp. KL116D]|uniref:hypothetical protein n=1 Tax=Streptomyces sp. KL116D TaxID=3045152 RepID=UPI0035568F96